MCKIIKNEDFCYMDFGLFPYCSCKGTNKDIMKHLKFNKEGCYFIDKIFSTFNVRRLAMYLNEYELYEIDGWEELEQCGIKNCEEMHKHFIISNQYGKRFELMIPKFVCKKVDDEFEHQIKMKLSKKLFNGYDTNHTRENGYSSQAWAVLNTDDENLVKLSERKIAKISSRIDTLKEDLEQNKKALAKYRKEHYGSENISKSKEATEDVKAKADIAAQNAEKSVTKKANKIQL